MANKVFKTSIGMLRIMTLRLLNFKFLNRHLSDDNCTTEQVEKDQMQLSNLNIFIEFSYWSDFKFVADCFVWRLRAGEGHRGGQVHQCHSGRSGHAGGPVHRHQAAEGQMAEGRQGAELRPEI